MSDELMGVCVGLGVLATAMLFVIGMTLIDIREELRRVNRK